MFEHTFVICTGKYSVDSARLVIHEANKLAKENWELITVSPNLDMRKGILSAFFKRKKQREERIKTIR